MTPSALFIEGINLMISGMGFVLVFLLILIWAIRLMSILINKYFPTPVTTPKAPSNSISLSGFAADDSERLRPAIVAAIHHHRRSQGLHK